MLLSLFAIHGLGIVCSALAGRRSMKSGLIAAAVAPAITATWAAISLSRGDSPAIFEFAWVSDLDLVFRFRSDGLALLMALLVAGIGALVFYYATGYFKADAPGGNRFPATLLAFSVSMLGLVLADSIWTFFIFWEFTSITSFLLVGHKHEDAKVRMAARRALLITGSGGLVLLAGLVVLAQELGTTNLSELSPVSGTAASVAAVLILIGAATKSAQVPFHVWLPGAMAAPTPVSAYLHSATMVKAGVLLVAVVGPAFAEIEAWKVAGLLFGITSMIWGAVGALRHRDAKLILAWGTVSQLGLLLTLLSFGSAKATYAAVAMLFAHALFKATLFLIVGEIDIRTGTRDVSELGGLAAKMPIAFISATAAGLSMMGAPPLVGFMTKEAAIEAALGLSGLDQAVGVTAITVGSVLTVAYTVRFLMTVFGPGPDIAVLPRRAAMTIPAAVLGASGFAGFVFVDAVSSIVGNAAVELNTEANVYKLIPWPGLTLAFIVSLAILTIGGLFGAVLSRRTTAAPPRSVGADLADVAIDGVLAGAPRFISRVQHGSLPAYLATMGFAASSAAVPFVWAMSLDHLTLWDSPIQAVLAAGIVATAVAGAFVESRLGAALTLGAIGIGVSGLFVIQGAPDLVLTQLLVETVIVVGFVLGLGQLARRFPPVSEAWKAVRIVVSLVGGLAVMVGLVASASKPAGEAPIESLTIAAVEEGGGKNVVNVILTDLRALDTLGEVVVLATVAIGILALARVRKTESMV